MSFNFGFFLILFFVFLFLVIGGIVAMIVTSSIRRRRNESAPQSSVHASVLAKRTSTQNHPNAGDVSGGHGYTSFTSYHVTFLPESGEQREFTVDGAVYDRLFEGDRGLLTFKGDLFIGFDNSVN